MDDERQKAEAVRRLVAGWKQIAARYNMTAGDVAEVFEIECDQGHDHSSFHLVDAIENKARREARTGGRE